MASFLKIRRMEKEIDRCGREMSRLFRILEVKEDEYYRFYKPYPWWPETVERRTELHELMDELNDWRRQEYELKEEREHELQLQAKVEAEFRAEMKRLNQQLRAWEQKRAVEEEKRQKEAAIEAETQLQASLNKTDEERVAKPMWQKWDALRKEQREQSEIRSRLWREQVAREAELRALNEILWDVCGLFVAGPTNNGYEQFLDGVSNLFEEEEIAEVVARSVQGEMVRGKSQMLSLKAVYYDARNMFDEMPNMKMLTQTKVISLPLSGDILNLFEEFVVPEEEMLLKQPQVLSLEVRDLEAYKLFDQLLDAQVLPKTICIKNMLSRMKVIISINLGIIGHPFDIPYDGEVAFPTGIDTLFISHEYPVTCEGAGRALNINEVMGIDFTCNYEVVIWRTGIGTGMNIDEFLKCLNLIVHVIVGDDDKWGIVGCTYNIIAFVERYGNLGSLKAKLSPLKWCTVMEFNLLDKSLILEEWKMFYVYREVNVTRIQYYLIMIHSCNVLLSGHELISYGQSCSVAVKSRFKVNGNSFISSYQQLRGTGEGLKQLEFQVNCWNVVPFISNTNAGDGKTLLMLSNMNLICASKEEQWEPVEAYVVDSIRTYLTSIEFLKACGDWRMVFSRVISTGAARNNYWPTLAEFFRTWCFKELLKILLQMIWNPGIAMIQVNYGSFKSGQGHRYGTKRFSDHFSKEEEASNKAAVNTYVAEMISYQRNETKACGCEVNQDCRIARDKRLIAIIKANRAKNYQRGCWSLTEHHLKLLMANPDPNLRIKIIRYSLILTQLYFYWTMSIESAETVFRVMLKKKLEHGTVINFDLGRHGLSEAVVEIIAERQGMRRKLNNATGLGVLDACSHSRLFDDGHWIFNGGRIFSSKMCGASNYVKLSNVWLEDFLTSQKGHIGVERVHVIDINLKAENYIMGLMVQWDAKERLMTGWIPLTDVEIKRAAVSGFKAIVLVSVLFWCFKYIWKIFVRTMWDPGRAIVHTGYESFELCYGFQNCRLEVRFVILKLYAIVVIALMSYMSEKTEFNGSQDKKVRVIIPDYKVAVTGYPQCWSMVVNSKCRKVVVSVYVCLTGKGGGEQNYDEGCCYFLAWIIHDLQLGDINSKQWSQAKLGDKLYLRGGDCQERNEYTRAKLSFTSLMGAMSFHTHSYSRESMCRPCDVILNELEVLKNWSSDEEQYKWVLMFI